MDSNTRSIILSLYLPTLFLSFATGMLTPIMPLYARSFEISYALVGLVLAAQGTGNLIGDIPAGIVLTKLGHKWTMLIGVSLFGLCISAMSWAHTVPELILYGFLAGLGNAIWNISRHAYMTGLIPLERRGRVSATFGGINRIGSFLGPLLGGTLAVTYGLRFPFLIFGLVAMIAFILSAFFVNESVTPRIKSRRCTWTHKPLGRSHTCLCRHPDHCRNCPIAGSNDPHRSQLNYSPLCRRCGRLGREMRLVGLSPSPPPSTWQCFIQRG